MGRGMKLTRCEVCDRLVNTFVNEGCPGCGRRVVAAPVVGQG